MTDELENSLNNSEKISIDLLQDYTGIKSDLIRDVLKLDKSVNTISPEEFKSHVSDFVKIVFEKNS